MSLRTFISKQFIDVIDFTEPEDGILAYRYPMQDREIQNGGKLTVRDSQFAVFVNEGKVADVFGPGLYTLNTNTLPILTYLRTGTRLSNRPSRATSTSSPRASRPTSAGARPTPSPFAIKSSAQSVCVRSASFPIT